MIDTSGFFTEEGMPVPSVTRAQMREIDRIAIEETGPSLLQMMEHAGRSLAELALRLLEERAQKARVVVLAGRGGNGGGGICAARHLLPRVGEVALAVSQPDRLTEGPKAQLSTYRRAGGREVDSADLAGVAADLVVDAVLGYSLDRAPRGRARELIGWANSSGAPVLSLDLPSGIDADTGAAPGVAIHPVATLTLALPKPGLAAAETGELWLADLGIPPEAYARAGVDDRPPFGSRFVIPLRQSP